MPRLTQMFRRYQAATQTRSFTRPSRPIEVTPTPTPESTQRDWKQLINAKFMGLVYENGDLTLEFKTENGRREVLCFRNFSIRNFF